MALRFSVAVYLGPGASFGTGNTDQASTGHQRYRGALGAQPRTTTFCSELYRVQLLELRDLFPPIHGSADPAQSPFIELVLLGVILGQPQNVSFPGRV